MAHYRMATAIQEYRGQPAGRLPIYLTDTLTPSYGKPAVPLPSLTLRLTMIIY